MKNMKKMWLPFLVIWTLTILMMLVTWSISHGDIILYKVPSGEVVEAFREPIPLQSGYDQVTVPNADLIVWPAPIGCIVGNKKWSKVILPITSPPTFVLDLTIKFFKCQPVSNTADVDQVALKSIQTLQGGQSDAELLRQATWAIYVLAVKCPATDVSSQCNTDRAKARTIETNLTGLNGQIEAIQKEAADFKAANGW